MLEFFRTYQRYFFFLITAVVIISFSFFGTSGTLGSDAWREPIAFKAINGHEVTRGELEDMNLFLATDNLDKQLYGGAWGPNFLNNGVIRNDFLATGLGQVLIDYFTTDFQKSWNQKHAKEKGYALYSHPSAPFIGVAKVWDFFSPDMKKAYSTLQFSSDPLTPEAVGSRIQLFLADKELPHNKVRQVIRYQERQYKWITPDQDLDRIDLSPFGYHTLNDWFGPQFSALVSEFIINTAILAKEKGYQVSQPEALADLIRNTQISYQEGVKNGTIDVTSIEEYFNEQLRRLNMDKSRVTRIWQQVLLFRRYFHDAGSSALVDAFTFKKFNDSGSEGLVVDLYRLPSQFRLAGLDSLKKFQVYLEAISKRNTQDLLAIPEKFLTIAEIGKAHPELVQKNYRLEIAEANFKGLQSEISLKTLWKWETTESNWTLLQSQFPDLGLKNAKTLDERYSALDELDQITRSKVDAFAMKKIIQENPILISNTLDKASLNTVLVGISTENGNTPFGPLQDKEKRQALIRFLNQAKLGEVPSSDSPLYAFSPDEKSYYRVKVIERESTPQLVTFKEASQNGVLNGLQEKVLEKYYLTSRENSPLLYQTESKEWRPYSAVKELVAENYFSSLLSELKKLDEKIDVKALDKASSKDKLATLRFYSLFEKIQKDPAKATQLIATKEDESPQFDRQIHVLKTSKTLTRGQSEEGVDMTELYELPIGGWSKIKTTAHGDMLLVQVKAKENVNLPEEKATLIEKARSAQTLLSNEVQAQVMRQLLHLLSSKDAISLEHLKLPENEEIATSLS